jgi:hypothetical protein
MASGSSGLNMAFRRFSTWSMMTSVKRPESRAPSLSRSRWKLASAKLVADAVEL